MADEPLTEATTSLPTQLWCSFCGSPQERVRLVAGPEVHICEECVELASAVLREGAPANESDDTPAGDDRLLSFRKTLHPQELIERAVEEFRGSGLTHEELQDVARGAFRRAQAEYLHGEEPPFQVYARERLRQAILAALPGR